MRGLLLVLMLAGAGGAEVIERIMAVVDSALILQSDVRAAVRFGLVPGVETASVETVLDRLIERRLMLTEVNRYAPPEPSPAAVERRLADVRSRFATPEALDAALAETGFTLDLLSRHLGDDLRIETYLRQRFGSVSQPSEADVLQYYRDHPEMFTRGGVLRPFGEAYQEARSALVDERRGSGLREWVTRLRQRATVSVPGLVVTK